MNLKVLSEGVEEESVRRVAFCVKFEERENRVGVGMNFSNFRDYPPRVFLSKPCFLWIFGLSPDFRFLTLMWVVTSKYVK